MMLLSALPRPVITPVFKSKFSIPALKSPSNCTLVETLSIPPPVSVIMSVAELMLYKSSPAPPSSLLLPVPPVNVSLPKPPIKVSLPLPPFRLSLPAPPLIMLLPLLPIIILLSALPVPLILSAPISVKFSIFAPKLKLTVDCTKSSPPPVKALAASVTLSNRLSTT